MRTRIARISLITRIPLVVLLAVGAVLLCTGALSGQVSTVDDARVERGRTVYQYWCATCHSSGPGMPGTTALAAKYKGKQPSLPAVLEERTDLTAASVRFFVRQGVSVMAPFRKTEISDADLEDLIGYLTRSKVR
jgi:mono/diheme cytochrome c family protein